MAKGQGTQLHVVVLNLSARLWFGTYVHRFVKPVLQASSSSLTADFLDLKQGVTTPLVW